MFQADILRQAGIAILFMPGMDGTGISFEPLQALLPDDIPVTIIRYPSDSLLDFDETVQCAKNQIQSDMGDVIVIAESFSGPVAVSLVGTGQLKAKYLILCATFARSPRPVLLNIFRWLPIEFLMSLPLPRLLLRLRIEGGPATTDLFLAMWKRVKTLVPLKTLAHRLRVIHKVDVRRWLPAIKIPCLYIQATADKTVPESCLSDFTQSITDLRVEKITGPHFILQAQPELCLAAILNFVEHVSKRVVKS